MPQPSTRPPGQAFDAPIPGRKVLANHALDTPEGIYVPMDAVIVPIPLANPNDVPISTINPLAADLAHPSAFTRGMRMAEIPAGIAQPQQSSGTQRHKPKLSLLRNRASVVSMAVVFEGYTKRMLEGQSASVAWVNMGRMLALMDLDVNAPSRSQQLSKILFSNTWPIVTALNRHTVSPSQIDLAVGLSNGEVLWIEAVSNRFSRMNKDGTLASNAPVTAISWVPQSATIVAVGYGNGSVGIYDIEREDGAPLASRNVAQDNSVSTATLKVIQSGTTPHKSNPVAFYNISNSQITALKFMGGSTLAVSSRDGYVRLIDMGAQQVTDVLPSYFGAISCMEFSPDHKYLIIGGEDDCLAAYNTETLQLVARFQGHHAFVMELAFDTLFVEEGTSSYRLGSVGEDGRLCLWDFSPETLPHPANEARSTMVGNSELHPFIQRSEIPVIFPTAQSAPEIDGFEPTALCDLTFSKDAISATSADGVIYTWKRP